MRPIEWKRRIKNVVSVLVDGKLVGIVVLGFEKKAKLKHIANIYSVYVKKDYRNKGIGNKLLESVITLAKKNKNIVKIKLTVNPKQKAAVRLYKKYGFRQSGVLKKEIYVNGKFYDELVMEKMI